MKTGQIIKLCLIIIAIIYTQIANGQFHLNKEIHSIKIKSVSFDIFTPINEDCKSFEKFGKAIKVSEFKKIDDLNKIISILKTAKLDTLKQGPLDVRGKIILYSKENVIKICLDYFYFLSNEKYYKMPEKLITLIEKLNTKK